MKKSSSNKIENEILREQVESIQSDVNELKKAGAEIYELGGVKPNPRLSLVREGIDLAKKEGIDFKHNKWIY